MTNRCPHPEAGCPPVESAREDEAPLVAAARAGNLDALDRLLRAHQAWIYNLALRMVWRKEAAEDATQEILLKAVTHLGSFEGRSKFSTWLYRVISNRCIDLRRKPRTENVDVVPEVADARPDASIQIERNELRDMLETAVQRLPEQQRIAVILSYHENMSNGEIAGVMETTVAAVESLLKRGRQQLRELLRRERRRVGFAVLPRVAFAMEA